MKLENLFYTWKITDFVINRHGYKDNPKEGSQLIIYLNFIYSMIKIVLFQYLFKVLFNRKSEF